MLTGCYVVAMPVMSLQRMLRRNRRCNERNTWCNEENRRYKNITDAANGESTDYKEGSKHRRNVTDAAIIKTNAAVK
jgi:primase-polymerase (primpol)-like protein